MYNAWLPHYNFGFSVVFLVFCYFFSSWVCRLLPRHKCFYALPLLLSLLLSAAHVALAVAVAVAMLVAFSVVAVAVGVQIVFKLQGH